MTSSSVGKHAGSGGRARTLMYVGRIGSLSTLSRRQSGFPFGSVVP